MMKETPKAIQQKNGREEKRIGEDIGARS